MDPLPEIERSVELEADPSDVWESVVDGDLAEEWLGARLEPKVGGEVQVPGRDILGTVEEIVSGESITWSWRDREGEPSQVEILIEPIGAGTKVTVTERLLEYRITNVPPVYSMAA